MTPYGKVLSLNIGLTLLVMAVIVIAMGQRLLSAQVAWGALFNVLVQFAIVTVIFGWLARQPRPTAAGAVERYLKAVRPYLPRSQRDDIISELAENLQSEIQERESELGRPLQESDVRAILDRHGHPLLAAGSYRDRNRTVAFGRRLIGPALFPYYIRVIGLIVGISVILFSVIAIAGAPITFRQVLFPLAIQCAVVTLLFSVLEICLPKFPRAY